MRLGKGVEVHTTPVFLERRALREGLTAGTARVRTLPGMRNHMGGQLIAELEGLVAEVTAMRPVFTMFAHLMLCY